VIVLDIELGVLALLGVAGYFLFIRPWSAMARDEERRRLESGR